MIKYIKKNSCCGKKVYFIFTLYEIYKYPFWWRRETYFIMPVKPYNNNADGLTVPYILQQSK
jgi:hypothetical protein